MLGTARQKIPKYRKNQAGELLEPLIGDLCIFIFGQGSDNTHQCPVGPLHGERIPEVKEFQLPDVVQYTPAQWEPIICDLFFIHLLENHAIDGEPVLAFRHRKAYQTFFCEKPAARRQTCFRRMNGFALALALPICNVQTDKLSLGTYIIDYRIVAEMQACKNIGVKKRSLAMPCPDIERELCKWFFYWYYFTKIYPMAKNKS